MLLLAAGCGDGGSGGGFGAIGGAFGGGSGSEPTSFLYVTNRGSRNISGFSINATTGGLVPLPGSPFPADSGPSAIAVLPNRFVAYVANGQANTVTAFAILTEGGLSQLSSTATNPNPVSVDTAPSALAISADEKFLYVTNRDSVRTFSIGGEGVLTRVGPTGGSATLESAPGSLALSHDGKFLYTGNSGVSEITAFSIAPSGLLTKIAPTGGNTNPLAIGGAAIQKVVASPNAPFLYVIQNSSNTVVVFRIESNGLLTRVPASGASSNPIQVRSSALTTLVLSRDGRFLYTASNDGTITVFSIGGDGLLSLVPGSGGQGNAISTTTSPVAMTLSPDGQQLYVAESGESVSAFRVATDTGLLSRLNVLVGGNVRTGTSPSGIAAFSSP